MAFGDTVAAPLQIQMVQDTNVMCSWEMKEFIHEVCMKF